VDDAVSRETPPVPEVARGVFGSRADVAIAFAEILATDAVTRGLIGPREAPRLWERHLLNCALVTDVISEGADVCDIGSGAGLPGLILAIRRPDLRVTLVEPLLRRTTFLVEVVDRLALDNVAVVRDRAEALHGSLDFAVVTSRAVAPLPRLLEWSMPLVRRGGELLAMKGSTASEEVAAASEDLRRWGGGTVAVLTLGVDVVNPPTTVIRVEGTRQSALGYGSRRAGPGRPAKPDRGSKGRGRPK
jgi:16S rRNA (guanine527-N7)-methyltransferase